MTHPLAWNTQPALLVEQRVHQCIGMQMPLHHRVGLAATHELHRCQTSIR